MTAQRATIAGSVVLAAYLATGIVAIPQDEVGVVRRFGAALREPWPPGLHWGLPWGVDRVDRLARDESRVVRVGTNGDFLTGDLKVVAARAEVHYRVSEAGRYLFSSRSAESALEALGESALAGAAAVRRIDDVLTSSRGEVGDQMRRQIQDGADALGLGVTVTAVRVGSVAPPASVAPAFADVAGAKGDRRAAVTRAGSYRDVAALDARGRSREIRDRAAARADALVRSARVDAERFARLVKGASRDPLAARRTMYRDALAELLPRFERTVVVAPGQGVDLSVTTGK